MTDAHCHVPGGEAVRELICGRDCFGTHPWEVATLDAGRLRDELTAHPTAGVGEIGLDRLHDRAISPQMREAFETQLRLAAELKRHVTLHGARCWGEVVRACRLFGAGVPAFLFHGFSRSDGLLPDIVRLNGFVSVGPAVLNDHAVNYRELVKKIPDACLLLETDRTAESAADCPPVTAVAAKVAELRGVTLAALEALIDANADRFVGGRRI